MLGLIVLAISLAAGVSLRRDGQQSAKPASAALVAGLHGTLLTSGTGEAILANGVTAHSAAVAQDEPSVQVEGDVVKFYFASGKAELPPGAQDALGSIVRGVAAGQSAVISGFHGVTGDAAQNDELARQRASVVRDALISLGIGEDKLELRAPEVTTASSSHAEARRVDVRLE